MPTLLADCIRAATPDVFETIHEPGVALTLWERTPPQDVAKFLSTFVDSGAPLALDFKLGPGDSCKVHEAVRTHFGGHITAPELNVLFDDVDRLVTLFRAASESDAVRVRLHRVVDAACALFHADTLSMRLLCTYHGAGTEWVSNADADRAQLGSRGRTIRKANRAIVPDPNAIQAMQPWHVAIFKGRKYPGGEHIALIHRSAPQCCEDHARIRLVLDTSDSGY
jgi:hypothetical protein